MEKRRSYGSNQTRERGRGRERKGFGKDKERTPRVFRKKVCRFCSDKAAQIDYKDMESIQKFLTEKGKIIPRRITGNCSKHQRALARAIKRSRHSALVAFQSE
ncbi:MAG: 30S ribosomal protein S18 [Candidatus Omnitrophica bacterium]|nr:30S ribosomal protein S18 [Candidatus Omnitrophota bacterium]